MVEPINRLNGTDTVSAGDQLAVYTQTSGTARKSAISTVQDYMQENLDFSGSSYLTQYAAPSAASFNVAIENASRSTHLILTPTALLADGSITLPTKSGLTDKQSILVNSTQEVTALTVDGQDATVTGAPTTILANGFFTLKYDKQMNVWYRVG